MRKAAADLDFEEAARLRDEIKRLQMLGLEFANEAPTPRAKRWSAAWRSWRGPKRARRSGGVVSERGKEKAVSTTSRHQPSPIR